MFAEAWTLLTAGRENPEVRVIFKCATTTVLDESVIQALMSLLLTFLARAGGRGNGQLFQSVDYGRHWTWGPFDALICVTRVSVTLAECGI